MSEFEHRVLTSAEAYIIDGNVRDHTRLLKSLPGKCAAKDCNYPLRGVDNYVLAGIGDVCSLCFTMYHVLADRAYWSDLHRTWENENRRNRRDL